MSDENLQKRFQARIEAELAELLKSSGSRDDERGPVALDQQSVGRLSRMDAMQVQAMAQESERRRQLRIAVLKASLARLESGDFGTCAVCDEPIAGKRLEFDPTVLLCISCARGEER